MMQGNNMNYWSGDGYTFISVPQGWRCPVCGNVYSPTMPFCTVCANQGKYTVNNIETPQEELENPTPQFTPYVVGARPQIALEEILAPIKEKIEQLVTDEEPETEEIRIRKEAYDLAIEDVIELIEEETEDRTLTIEIPRPCGANCEKCTDKKKCKEKN